MATMGVTCSTTAKGKNERSTQRQRAKSRASRPPPTTAAISASKVMRNVTSMEANSVSQSLTSVRAISDGAGRT